MGKKYDEGYDKGYVNGGNGDMSQFLVVGIIIGVIITILTCLSSFYFSGDNYDVINVEGMGTILCAEHGLEYSHREIISIDDYLYIPKIYCKQETKLEDGIVVGINLD